MSESVTKPQIPSLTELQPSQTPFVEFVLTRGPDSDNGATPWTATLGIGTPPQSLRIMLDTGTVNTWVTASCCASAACQVHQSYNPEHSSSYHPSCSAPTSVDFGPWGSMGVVLGEDVCYLDYEQSGRRSFTPMVEPMSLYLAVSYDGKQFLELDCDGGFAIPSIACQQPSALLEQLHRQRLIRYPVASFWFDAVRGEGRCRMGGLDPERFEPASFNVLPLRPLEGELAYLWTVRLDTLTIGERPLGKGVDFVLDTGSSVFKGGHTIIHRMLEAITHEGRLPTTVDNEAALAAYPTITLTLGGIDYTLTPQQYFLKIGATQWDVGVQYLEGLPEELLVVGSVFLDSVYSAFFLVPDGHGAVGLATPRQQPRSVSGVWINEFGSTLEIGPIASDGTFRGTYRSDTGATGVYPVVGVTDPEPVGTSITIAFSVNWRSLEGSPDPSWHWVSAFSGLLEEKDGEEVLSTLYLLQQNVSEQVQAWQATAVYPSVFKRRGA